MADEKAREFLVLGIKGIYNTRAFTWPHQMLDRDWMPNWKRKQQELIRVIEISAYEESQMKLTEWALMCDELEARVKEFEQREAKLVEVITDMSTMDHPDDLIEIKDQTLKDLNLGGKL